MSTVGDIYDTAICRLAGCHQVGHLAFQTLITGNKMPGKSTGCRKMKYCKSKRTSLQAWVGQGEPQLCLGKFFKQDVGFGFQRQQ